MGSGLEIERKYLLSENNADYTTPEFESMFGESLESIILQALGGFGSRITQVYLPPEDALDIAEKYVDSVDFKPVEGRIRRDISRNNSIYTLTLKSGGNLSRKELNVVDTGYDLKDAFDRYVEDGSCPRISKYRLKKESCGHIWEFDIYPSRDLVVCECEVSSVEEAKDLPMPGKEITDISAYKNRNLADR